MDLIQWRPFHNVERTAGLLGRLPMWLWEDSVTPRVDVFQTESDVVVKAETPGVAKEHIDLYVDANSIRLSGQFQRSSEFKEENVFRAERRYGSFSRTIPLPVEVKPEGAKAEYKDGILSITIPKAENGKTWGRRIDIQ